MTTVPTLAPMRLIKETVAEHFGVSVLDLESNRRNNQIVIPRHTAIYLCRILTRASYPAIGRAFGRRDHTSIIHAVSSLEARMDADHGLLETVQALRDRLMPEVVESREVTRTAMLLGVRILSSEDLLRSRVDAVFLSLEEHIRRSPFTVLERLESVAMTLERHSHLEAAE